MSKIWCNYTKDLEKQTGKNLQFFWNDYTMDETIVYSLKDPNGCKTKERWCGSHLEPCDNMEEFCCVPKYLIGTQTTSYDGGSHWIIKPEVITKVKEMWKVS